MKHRFLSDFVRNCRNRQYIRFCQFLWIYTGLYGKFYELTGYRTLPDFVDIYRTLSDFVEIDSTPDFIIFCRYISDFMRNSEGWQYIRLCQILWVYIGLYEILWSLSENLWPATSYITKHTEESDGTYTRRFPLWSRTYSYEGYAKDLWLDDKIFFEGSFK